MNRTRLPHKQGPRSRFPSRSRKKFAGGTQVSAVVIAVVVVRKLAAGRCYDML